MLLNKPIKRDENFVYFLSCAIFVCYCQQVNFTSFPIVSNNEAKIYRDFVEILWHRQLS